MHNNDNEKLIDIFSQLEQLHTTLDNIYEARSYKKVVDTLKKYPTKIKSADELKGIEGIGNRTRLKVDEILKTNKLKLLEELKKDKNIIARLELQRVLGIGPKLSKKMVEKDGIKSVKQLKEAYKKGNIDLTHMQIIGLKYFDKLNAKIPRNEITKYYHLFEKTLHKEFPNIEVHMAGSYRRGKETSGDIDMILTSSSSNKSNIFDNIVDYIMKQKLIIEIINRSKNAIMGITNTGRQIDLRYSPYNLLPFYQLYFGSGVDFSRKIRQIAKEKGYKLTNSGLYNRSGHIIMNKAKNEKEIFNKLGIKYVEPKDR